jgi:hypothetical protein
MTLSHSPLGSLHSYSLPGMGWATKPLIWAGRGEVSNCPIFACIPANSAWGLPQVPGTLAGIQTFGLLQYWPRVRRHGDLFYSQSRARGLLRPTAGRLRIGKPLPERVPRRTLRGVAGMGTRRPVLSLSHEMDTCPQRVSVLSGNAPYNDWAIESFCRCKGDSDANGLVELSPDLDWFVLQLLVDNGDLCADMDNNLVVDGRDIKAAGAALSSRRCRAVQPRKPSSK